MLVDINLFDTANSLAHGRDFTSLFLKFAEVGSTRATYPKPSRANQFPLPDLGASFMLTRSIGVGVSYSRTTYEDVARLTATIPHPVFLNASSTGTGETADALNREEAEKRIFGALVPLQTNRFQLRIFGGPSFFSYSADMVRDVSYAQTFDELTPQSSITINGFTSEKVRGDAIGFHVGGDFTYFFRKRFGVSWGVRFSRGTITVAEEPMSKLSQEIRVGSALGFLGVRFRLGR
jgi:hypothetical protein